MSSSSSGCHDRRAHLGAAHVSSCRCGAGPDLIGLLAFDSLNILLVLNFLLNVLVSLQNLVVLELSHLDAFVHELLELALKGSHLIGLILQ